jgi:hypothetical protein
MDEVRLMLWMDGKLPDSELTADEVEWLQEAVFNAIVKKTRAAKAPKGVQ